MVKKIIMSTSYCQAGVGDKRRYVCDEFIQAMKKNAITQKAVYE